MSRPTNWSGSSWARVTFRNVKSSVATIGTGVKARKPMIHGRDEEEPLARLAARQGRHPEPGAALGDRGSSGDCLSGAGGHSGLAGPRAPGSRRGAPRSRRPCRGPAVSTHLVPYLLEDVQGLVVLRHRTPRSSGCRRTATLSLATCQSTSCGNRSSGRASRRTRPACRGPGRHAAVELEQLVGRSRRGGRSGPRTPRRGAWCP